jgi:hypothetical protein
MLNDLGLLLLIFVGFVIIATGAVVISAAMIASIKDQQQEKKHQ